MSSPVAHLHMAASLRENVESFASAYRQYAEVLSGKPKPGRLFGIGRISRSGSKRSERQIQRGGALRSDSNYPTV